ncbi:homeodomain-only protein-like [Acanthaster planci]|uniref:Homeodomain-only protein n=1 Tax=Acanthaster planci TaxID=133434 RepID=A0A8B7YJ67_ACAPL|nr:homeodomain-only protein-like [Acanthaster planci]
MSGQQSSTTLSGVPVTPQKPGRHQPPTSPRNNPVAMADARLASPEDSVVNNVSPIQAKILEDNFQQNKNMDEITLEIVAAEAGLSPQDTARWFQHRRALWRQNEGLNPNSRTLEEL